MLPFIRLFLGPLVSPDEHVNGPHMEDVSHSSPVPKPSSSSSFSMSKSFASPASVALRTHSPVLGVQLDLNFEEDFHLTSAGLPSPEPLPDQFDDTADAQAVLEEVDRDSVDSAGDFLRDLDQAAMIYDEEIFEWNPVRCAAIYDLETRRIEEEMPRPGSWGPRGDGIFVFPFWPTCDYHSMRLAPFPHVGSHSGEIRRLHRMVRLVQRQLVYVSALYRLQRTRRRRCGVNPEFLHQSPLALEYLNSDSPRYSGFGDDLTKVHLLDALILEEFVLALDFALVAWRRFLLVELAFLYPFEECPHTWNPPFQLPAGTTYVEWLGLRTTVFHHSRLDTDMARCYFLLYRLRRSLLADWDEDLPAHCLAQRLDYPCPYSHAPSFPPLPGVHSGFISSYLPPL